MGLDDVSAVDPVGSHSAVVRALGSGESVLGPAEGMLILVEEGVLLLDAEPRLLIFGPGKRNDLSKEETFKRKNLRRVSLGHDFVAELPVVGLCGLLVVLVGLAEDNLVVSQPEGILVHGNGVQVDVGVGTLGLSGGGAIEVPDGKL